MGMRTIRWLFLLMLLTAGASPALAWQTACYPEGSGATGCLPVLTIPANWTRCESDADCVRVAWSCCDCFAGGISTAIHARYLEQHAKRYAKLCPEFLGPTDPARCPQVITCPSRGTEPEFAVPFCNERGRCEFGFRD